MNSKDNISEGFEELLGGINKELELKKDYTDIKSCDNNTQQETIIKDEITAATSSDTPSGTRVFDAIKTDNADSIEEVPGAIPEINEIENITVYGSENQSPIPGQSENYNFQSDSTNQNVEQLSYIKNTPVQQNENMIYQEYSASDFDTENVVNKKSKISSAQKSSEHNQRRNPRHKKKVKKYGVWGSVVKFFVYIIFVGVVSVLLAKYIIGVGNDVFAFIKDTYDISEAVYITKGNSDNSFTITGSEISGNKLTLNFEFARELTAREKNSLEANISLINAKDNSVTHNYGKYRDSIKDGKEIYVDLSTAKMEIGDYILRLTVSMENDISFITEFTVNKKIREIAIPANATTNEVAELLKDNGVIDHPFAFKLYTDLKKGRSGTNLGKGYIEGDHMLYSGMDYDGIIETISPRISVRTIVKLTFPEGSTVDEIIDILIKGGVKNTREQYVDVINNYDFDYKFLDLLEEQGLPYGRVYRLEGYLFPDTYEFYSDASPQSVIDKFLANFERKFDETFYAEAAELGYSVDEIIRIASIIELEAGLAEDRGDISSVFHNRLKSVKNNNSIKYPRLQSDATTDYASYNLTAKTSLGKDSKSAKFSIDLANYNLVDANYYFNFNINTGKTRSVALIHIQKSTNADGEPVYKITDKSVSDDPTAGNSGTDLKMTIKKASIDGSTVNCEFDLSHSIDEKTFKGFTRKLSLFRKEYSTYLTDGLMSGAVANPGYDSITAALYPNDTNYYYFVADKTGKSHFTSSNDAHNAKISELQKNGLAVVTR